MQKVEEAHATFKKSVVADLKHLTASGSFGLARPGRSLIKVLAIIF